jgi:glycosyltransferase involved in cell wall biosynthesis
MSTGVGNACLSIVVLTRNSESTLPSLLSSIERQSVLPLETIVVDAESTDHTVLIAQDHGARVVGGTSKAASRNRGARLAHGEDLLFLDSDMELSPRVVEQTIVGLASTDTVSIREEVVANDYWGKARRLEKLSVFGSVSFEVPRGFRAVAFDSIGGYDERAGNSMEDTDLQVRVLEKKLSMGWVTEPIFHHEEGLRLMPYLKKRRGLSTAYFRTTHPEFWKSYLSPVRRLTLAAQYAARGRDLKSMALIPGIAVMRSAELLSRSHG